MIPQSFVQDLLNRVDIVDVVGRYVQLKKGGANFSGLCPFHNEKSPSFTVSPTKQFYHCFGCGANGTAIGFLMEYSGLGFVESVKDLAQNVGMTVPEQEDRLPPAQRAELQAKTLALSDAMTLACNFFRQQLRSAQPAIDYLKGRGLTGEIAAKYWVGYAPDGWDSLRQVFTDYDDDALVESGLVIDRSDEDNSHRKRYDRFRDRIMFPIRNTKGQVIGFGGRVMGAGEPKYLNSPETPLFQKGSELYGLFEARQAIRDKDYVLVTEGYMDVVALAQYGFEQAVATLGTACTATHVQKLLRQTDNVIFSFDGDAAGRRAARRALEACLPHASDSRSLKFLFLPTEHDPDSYVREHGTAQFEQLVQDATPLSQFLLSEVTEGKDLGTAEGRARVQFDAKPLIQSMPASGLRLQLLRQLAQLTDSTAQELEGLFELRRSTSGRSPGPAVKRSPPVELERQVLRLLLAHPAMHDLLDSEALDLIAQTSPDEGGTLRTVVAAAAGLPEGATLAVLSEALRAQGVELGSLVAEIAAESPSEPDLARKELAGAIRQTTMKSLKAELESLASAGLVTDSAKARYREVSVELEKIRAAVDKDLGD
ncbi:MAG: DNA primase [Oxalobacteraceae bacterium]|nr:DNA primase [Oxalobacteraceae bacterium]